MLHPTEDQVQRAVVDALTWTARPGVYWFHAANGGHRDPRTAAKLVSQGVRPGVPDLVLCIKGRFFGLELKRAKGGRLSERQKAHADEIMAAGGLCTVAYGLDEALGILRLWGAIR
jgi:VRR-NUC domain